MTTEIVNHNGKLENIVRDFIKDECGKHSATKIIDIQHYDQVTEPLIDTMTPYRLTTNPNQIHIYQRKTKVVPGYLYGKYIKSDFHKICTFTSVRYELPTTKPKETPQVKPQHNVPDLMSTMISQLKDSPKFKFRYSD